MKLGGKGLPVLLHSGFFSGFFKFGFYKSEHPHIVVARFGVPNCFQRVSPTVNWEREDPPRFFCIVAPGPEGFFLLTLRLQQKTVLRVVDGMVMLVIFSESTGACCRVCFGAYEVIYFRRLQGVLFSPERRELLVRK